ncbi:MAG: class I SAM-dependent methyltransferase, partial [Singulisphaera sp.]
MDIGCGKGRVLNFWLERFPNNRIIGVELDDRVADRTRRRLERWRNVKIITGDAVAALPAEGTIFWMFNPFK